MIPHYTRRRDKIYFGIGVTIGILLLPILLFLTLYDNWRNGND